MAPLEAGKWSRREKRLRNWRSIQKKLEPNKKKDQGGYEGVSDDLVVARAWVAFADGKHDEAVASLRTIADKEEGENESSGGIPVREMIGDMLLGSERPQEALAEYEASLKNDPGRFDSLYGAAKAAEMAHKNDKAKDYYSQLVGNCKGSQSDRAELKYAREEMDKLAQASTERSTVERPVILAPAGIIRIESLASS